MQQDNNFSKIVVSSFESSFAEAADKKGMVKVFNQFFQIKLQLADMIYQEHQNPLKQEPLDQDPAQTIIKISNRKWKFVKHSNSEETVEALQESMRNLDERIHHAFESLKEKEGCEIDMQEIKLKIFTANFKKLKSAELKCSFLETIIHELKQKEQKE